MTVHQRHIDKAATPAEQRFLDLYADVAERLPGALLPAVRAWREAALEAFVVLGWPHRRVEEWKYTDLRALMPEVYPLAGLADSAPGGEIQAVELDAYRAVFIDGRFRSELSTIQDAPGVAFQSLGEALGEEQTAVKTVAGLPLLERDVIAALSTAFATDGALIEIAPGAKLAKPIHLIYAASEPSPKASALQNAISLGEGAQVSIVESHISGGPGQAFALTRLAIGDNASLKHARLALGARNKHLSSIAAELGAGARYEPLQAIIGGDLTRAQALIRFKGEGARCHYTGAMLLRGSEHADITLVVDHVAPECESRELAKGVVDGRAHGVFQGKVIVQRGAQKTDGKQMSNALLLSDEAEFDSKPELEIYADDVACGHGATAGQIDEDLMFYLRARGIPKDEARALLISAFIGEALDRIEDERLREALQEKVDAWLAA